VKRNFAGELKVQSVYLEGVPDNEAEGVVNGDIHFSGYVVMAVCEHCHSWN